MSTNSQLSLASAVASSGGAVHLVRRYAVWTLLVTVLVAAAAVGAASLVTPTYASSATVVVEPRVSENTTPLEPDMGTEKQVAQSGVVLDPVARQLGISEADLADGLTVGVSPDTHILEISYSHPDAVVAEQRVQHVAVAYVNYRNAATVDGPDRRTLQATLVTRAAVPSKPEGRPIAIFGGVGALAGLTLGALTAFVRDRLDDGLRGTDDVERYAGVPVLTSIPLPREAAGPFVVNEPASATARAFRQLRTRLQTLAGRRGGATLLIASPDEREGRSTTAVDLAASLALSGARVVLVDEGARFDEELLDTVVPGLRMLRADGTERSELPAPGRLAQQLNELRASADYVIVDSGPMSTTTDAMTFASVVDLVVVVVDGRRTTRTRLATAVRELRACGATPAGAVMTVPARERRATVARPDPYTGLLEPVVPEQANSSSVL